MKITIYELLGLVKNGKAPKKIKIDNDILTLSKANTIQYNFERYGQLNWDYYIENYRLDEKFVEILDKDFKLEEKKIPENLTDILRVDDLIPPVDENMYKIWTQTIKNHNKINEICDCLKSKGE